MSIGKKIASGREAEVFEWNPDGQADESPKVLKLFVEGRSRANATRELEITAALKTAGGAVPGVFGEVVEHNGRYGVVFERIYGTDMLEMMKSRPWTAGSVGRTIGQIHVNMHRAMPVGLPRLKDQLEQKIANARPLTTAERDQVLAQLTRLPDGEQVYHGDFHPGNVLMQDDGQPIVIDWPNAGIGDPMADVARTELLATVGWRALPQRRARWFGRWVTAYLLRSSMKSYFVESDADPRSVEGWRTAIAAARLSENIPAETSHVLHLVRSRLAKA